MSQFQGLYPYTEQDPALSFPGEMPEPEPVGQSDPGISSLKANADHSHASSTDSGTVVQERLQHIYGGWGSGVLPTGSNWAVLTNMGTLNFSKRFSGTVLRCSFGTSCWCVGPTLGNCAIAISPTNSMADVVVLGQLWFNTSGDHRHWTGAVDIPNRSMADYTFSWWAQGLITLNTDGYDSFWSTVAEVWP